MSLTLSQKAFIDRTVQQNRILLNIYSELSQLNALWAGAPNYDSLIDQTGIDGIPTYLGAGLTIQNLTDDEFALAQIKTIIDNALVPITVLASIVGV